MIDSPDRSSPIVRFTFATLAVNLLVIVWGALVRATGSGAGCGNHWPLCNGEVIPPSPTVHTIIELTHRVTSGLALVLIVALVLWTRRRFAAGHWARRGAMASLILMLIEAAIGAGLVKFELVAHNASLARAFSLGAHLINTQLLLAAIFLTARWADGRRAPTRLGIGRGWWLLLLAMVALLAIGMSGAIASLGDTLFPARTLTEGLAQDRDPTAHVLLRLRVWHPVLALVTGALLIVLTTQVRHWHDDPRLARAARVTGAMVLVQWSVGLLALVMLVPMALQLLHLITADLLWLSVVHLAAEATAPQIERTTVASMFAASASNTVPAPDSR
ncbi:MAG: COX15/CtaA family protein [Gemmatimonadota bacterium]